MVWSPRSLQRDGVLLALGCVTMPACADVVVGYFSAGTGTSDGGSSAMTSTSTSTAPASDTSTGGFVGPGCFSDDFEDGVIDDSLWNTWVEEDSAVEELGGQLKFTPPTRGLFDTGLVGHFDYHFGFDQGRVRLRVALPPAVDRPVVLFLMVLNDTERLSIALSEAQLEVVGVVDDVDAFRETLPAMPYPAWIGIRANQSQVYFEISDDGAAWSTVAIHDQPAAFDEARVLVMAQTYGDNAEPTAVSIDDLEVCLQ